MYELLTMANQTTEDVFSLRDNLLKWTKSQIGKLNVVYQDAFICCQQPPFRGLRVVPCKLT